MIGLTTALAAQSGQENSAGFAIAVDQLFQRMLKSLKDGRLPEYGFLGIQPEDLREADLDRGLRGARVSVVLPGLPGDQAGLRTDDIIIRVGDKPIATTNDLFRELSSVGAGDELRMLVQRFRFGSQRPELQRLTAIASKKPVSNPRPAFARNAPQPWRRAPGWLRNRRHRWPRRAGGRLHRVF